MSQELIDSVNELVTETTALLNQYTSAKNTIDDKVSLTESNAETSTTNANATATNLVAAEQAVTDATAQAVEATAQALSAKSYKESAAEISGLSTVTEAVALALTDANQYAMTKAEFFANAEQRKRESAGSGFLEWGKHTNAKPTFTPINEGLCTSTESSNVLRIGKYSGGSSVQGTSRTYNPLVLVNGVTHNVTSVRNPTQSEIKFPEAEQGTRSYDSATGEVIDYLTDVDPKYGDVAADLNEAVARNFEGLIKNGDFRDGTTYWGTRGAATVTVTDNVIRIEDTTATADSAATQTITFEENTTYVVEGESRSVTAGSQPVVLIEKSGFSGFYGGRNYTTEFAPFSFEFTIPVGGTGSWQINIREESGDVASEAIEFRNVSIRKTSNQPILSRQDYCFLETFHEKVSDKDIVMPLGNVQYGATTYEGITLSKVTDLGVLQGYSAFGEWDTDTEGYGVKWSTLTDTQKKIFLDDPDNNLYFDAEANELIQVRYRVRVVKGVGDDWNNVVPYASSINSDVNAVSWLSYSPSAVPTTTIGIRGTSTAANDWYGGVNSNLYKGSGRSDYDLGDTTTWQGMETSSRSHNGLCFALPICLVQR